MDMMNEEYRNLKSGLESLRAEMVALNHSLDELKRDYARLADSDYKDTIQDEDRKLLNETLQELRAVHTGNKMLFLTAVCVVIVCVGLNGWTLWKMRDNLAQVNHNYELTTAILSNDAHYWFDGLNYVVAHESPAGVYLQRVYADYQKAKAAQSAPQE